MSADTAIGTAIGAVLGFAVSFVFYVLNTRDLRREADHLATLVEVVAEALERAGLVKLARDQHGKITGIHVEGGAAVGSVGATAQSAGAKHATGTAHGSVMATGSVTGVAHRAEDDEPPRVAS